MVFDFAGIDRKRKAKISITIVFFGQFELEVIHNPHELFFFKNLSDDKNKKILYGEDLFKKKDFKLTNQHLLEMLFVDLKHTLRKSLDDENYRLMATYHLFKVLLRTMLINYDVTKKDDLISSFEKIYGDDLKLPIDSKRILYNDLRGEDFEAVLNFAEACLKYLKRNV